MCGIWGFQAREGTKNEKTIQTIIKRADERGGHSYGFFAIMKNGKHLLVKQTGRPDPKTVCSLIKDSIICIGHSRLATSGENSIFDGQPIVREDFALVHNGITEGYIPKKAVEGFEAKTNNDSELMIPLIKNKAPIEFDHAYLAIQFTPYDWEFKMSSKGLPLVMQEEDGVTYFCSKQW
jgi:glucosamine 6-phosphate synthetase-like amidotransferase/phosphosugar isomerase protein